jgi:hypothetical protein
MRVSKNKCLLTLCVAVLFLLIEISFATDDSPATSLLPAGLAIETEYRPGFGAPVGKVLVVRGDVIIIHANEQRGYMAAKDLPLYKNDTIVTQPQGRARLMLNDGSLLTLASKTKLVISRVVYEPKKKGRSSYIQQDGGKVRYWIRKLLGYNPSEFKVKTPTAVAGVRGSDFIISVTPARTEVTALKQTELEVVSVAAPGANPTLVLDFEHTVIEADALPTNVERIAPEKIEQIMQEVNIAPVEIEPEAELKNDAWATDASPTGEDGENNQQEQAEPGELADAQSEGQQDESPAAAPGTAVSEEGASAANSSTESMVTGENGEEVLQGDLITENIVEVPLILVPETELVLPEELTDIQELEAQIPLELSEVWNIQNQEQAVLDQQQTIMEQVQEEIVELNRSLPAFPGPPQ